VAVAVPLHSGHSIHHQKTEAVAPLIQLEHLVVAHMVVKNCKSGPDALLVSKACRTSTISSSEHRRSGGHRSGCTPIWSISEVSNGGSDRLKHLEKNWFNIDAFSLSDEATESLCRKVGIEEDELFIVLQNLLDLRTDYATFPCEMAVLYVQVVFNIHMISL